MNKFEVNLPVISNVRDSNSAALQGTAAEFVQKKVKINGIEVDAISMGVLAKFGLVKTIGDAVKVPGKRGRAGKVLAFVPAVDFKVEI